MTLGMGMDEIAIHHVAAFTECHDITLVTHLMIDHAMSGETLREEAKNSLTMLHMSLHSHVIEVRDE